MKRSGRLRQKNSLRVIFPRGQSHNSSLKPFMSSDKRKLPHGALTIILRFGLLIADSSGFFKPGAAQQQSAASSGFEDQKEAKTTDLVTQKCSFAD